MDYKIESCRTSFGKTGVKILYVNRSTPVHQIKEFKVQTLLKLDSEDELSGNNEKVIPTDTQKNTVYILAKKFGIETAEDFAVLLCNWFLKTYSWVTEVKVNVEELPWKRVEKNGEQHVHAFVNSHDAIKVCEVSQVRGENFKVTSGISGLQFIKTTKSGFENFNKCPFTVLPETKDRILSSIVDSNWTYSCTRGLDFDKTWNFIKDLILDTIVGPPKTGVYSGGVQETAYMIEKDVMKEIPQVQRIKINMPNVHYFNFDFSKFPKLPYKGDNTVFVPQTHPSGLIITEAYRKPKSKL